MMHSRILLTTFTSIFILFAVSSTTAQNSLNGLVFNQRRLPVANISVDLLDDLERHSRTTTTNGSGLFIFNNLPAGVYYLRVRVAGTPFLRAIERVQLGSTNRSQNGRTTGSESRQINFYLQIARNNKSLPVNAVVFGQAVPKDAEAHYDAGVVAKDRGDTSEAANRFRKAISIYPTYFYANFDLAKIYFDDEDFKNAAEHFEKAAKAHERSYAAVWGLALSLEKRNANAAVLSCLNSALAIRPDSVEANLLRGIILRRMAQNNLALDAMLKAKQFAKNSYPEVHWNLGLLYYYNFGDPGMAADELELYLSALSDHEGLRDSEKSKQVKKLIAKMRTQIK